MPIYIRLSQLIFKKSIVEQKFPGGVEKLKASIPEYWIVNPMERNVIVYTLINGEFSGSKLFTEGEKARSKHFKGLEVEVDRLFEGV